MTEHDTFFNFIRRCQNVSDILIKHRKVTTGKDWTEWESICRIIEEVGEVEKCHRKNEGDERILEEASDVILATIAHLNREHFTTEQIRQALAKTLVKIEVRGDKLQKEMEFT